MTEGRRIVAVIPARSGSKGVKDKNIRTLAGVPLITHTVRAAMSSSLIARTIVTTDSEKIAAIASANGAEIPFIRPAELSDDDSTTNEVVAHLISELGFKNELLVLLQPTSPLRLAHHIDEAIQKFIAGDYKSLVSICEIEKSPFWQYWIEDDELRPILENKDVSSLRQHQRKAYSPNGAIYIVEAKHFAMMNKFIGVRTGHYVMDKKSSFDIDDLLDFEICEYLMRYKI